MLTIRGDDHAVYQHRRRKVASELGGRKEDPKVSQVQLNERISQLMLEFKEGLRAIYGSRLRGVYLYGSYARGEQDRESDIDVLIVLEDFDYYGVEVDRTSIIGSSLSLAYDTTISKVFVRYREWLKGETPFLNNVRHEAMSV